MSNLAKIESTIPIKAIPEQELNMIILTQFTVWVANLLSLTDETSANRLETALPAIKEHCWSMGFVEIKKMFEMYADNKLSISPIPNYFDRILLGKIVDAYKSQKQKPVKEINTIQDMEETNKVHLHKFFRAFFLTHYINDCYVHLAYKFLEDNGFIKLSKEDKLKLMEDANLFITIEKNNELSLKNNLSEFVAVDITKEEKIFEAKKIAIRSCLKNMDENQAKEIELILTK